MSTQNLIDLAQRYFVSDLPGSTIPSSRLRTVLEKIQGNQPLTSIGFGYLQQLGLYSLGQLAHGEITYETFREVAAPAERVNDFAAGGGINLVCWSA